MRMRVNRLVYVVIGAALAVGLLVSVFVRPEARLTASEDCYGLCPSVTALSLSSSTVTYGNEQVEKFGVKVSAGASGTGVPTGYVVVESGTKVLCSIHLYRGTGSCSPAAEALARGSHTIAAHYSGDENFKPSTSSKETLTVLRHSSLRNPSATALLLSSSTATYGNEQVEGFSVRVTEGTFGTGVPTPYEMTEGTFGTGVATGDVVVESGTKVLCSIHLYRGTGSCSPAAEALARGSHTIAAYYSGDENFKPSTSSRKILTVL